MIRQPTIQIEVAAAEGIHLTNNERKPDTDWELIIESEQKQKQKGKRT